ncbi:MAG: type 4 fimbrial biosis protein PilM, type pilus assembly protein PilM [Candidatus Parcubacteria bacterium]|jgi:type IV pilus assembly protein PilM
MQRIGAQSFSRALARWFPTPSLIYPASAGIDISDASVKWLALSSAADGYEIGTSGEQPLQEGIVINGVIQNVDALAEALHEVRRQLRGIVYAHAALPEEAAYVFEMHVPDGTKRSEILHMIEFEFEGRVPIPPSEAVFDFDVIQTHDGVGADIGVAVFPRELAESYVSAFAKAGIGLLSLEIEARSIARAVTSAQSGEPISLLVDFGRARTGFAVLKRGIPIFTSTVEVGGDAITRALVEKLKLTPEDAITFRNEQGLVSGDGAKSPGSEAVTPVASALADEVARHYHYWDTRRNERGERMTPVERVVLVGGSSNLNGLSDYIAGRVQAPAFCGDVWRHVCNFNEYVPSIDRRASLQYATAIGLALRAVEPLV